MLIEYSVHDLYSKTATLWYTGFVFANMILSKLVISFDNLPGILGGIHKLK